MTERSAPILLDHDSARAFLDGRDLQLTTREFKALSILVARAGALCSKDYLAGELWPELHGDIGDNNIEQLVSRLRRKLGDDPRDPRYLLTMRGGGYRLLANGGPQAVETINPVRTRRQWMIVGAAFAAVGVVSAFVVAAGWPMGAAPDSNGAVTRAAAGPVNPRFQEDFESPSGSLFQVGSDANRLKVISDRVIVNGEYRVSLFDAAKETGVHLGGPDWIESGDFAVEVEARAESGEDILGYGLLFNQDNLGGLRVQLVPSRGTYRIVAVDPGSVRLVSFETSTAVRGGSAVNHLRLEVRGHELRIIVNDTLVRTLVDPALSERPVKLLAGVWAVTAPLQRDDPGAVVFDNFKVFALPR